MHYAIPEMFSRIGVLDAFYTDIIGEKGWPKLFNYFPKSILPTSLVKLSQRKPKIPHDKLIHFPWLGMKIGYKLKQSTSLEQNLEIYNWYNKEFQLRSIKAATNIPRNIYSFNGASLELFEEYSNSFKVLEQTIAPFVTEMELLAPEFEKYSDWSLGKIDYNSPSAIEFAQRELKELELSDKVICASNFVKKSLISHGVEGNKISVVPYGVDLSYFKSFKREGKSNERLKVLFVGRIGLRKGAQYVLELAKRLKDVAEFTMVGPIELSEKGLKELSKFVTIQSSVPKEKLLDYYKNADVFLLPSMCEGSATVVYEALAMGLPCIVTDNTGSIVVNNESGFIVDTGAVEEIERSILKLRDVELRKYMASNAEKLALEGSIDAYLKRLEMVLI